MSDGEFEKRFDREGIRALWMAIGEAKKEFPLRLSDGSLYAKFGGKSDSETIQQLLDVIDWFSTWFGDDE